MREVAYAPPPAGGRITRNYVHRKELVGRLQHSEHARRKPTKALQLLAPAKRAGHFSPSRTARYFSSRTLSSRTRAARRATAEHGYARSRLFAGFFARLIRHAQPPRPRSAFARHCGATIPANSQAQKRTETKVDRADMRGGAMTISAGASSIVIVAEARQSPRPA